MVAGNIAEEVHAKAPQCYVLPKFPAVQQLPL